MREYVKVYCCGDCIHYNLKKHKCSLGARDEGEAQDHFYRDCPLGICVEQESTVDAELVKHGKWIEYPECLKHEKAFAEEDIVCSYCGEVFNTLDNDTDRFKYCPNCGAKMDGEER